MFDTVLVANRGEIAVRVVRTLRELGIRSVAVHSDPDADAPHVHAADVAVRIGPAPAAESYLRIEAILEAAARTGAQAIHPGYGFLSENARFAQACADAGIVFVGPPIAAIEAMGDKIRAKQTVAAAGVPVVPGVHEPGMRDDELVAAATQVGYPLLVKASAGGGGKGMRVVREPDDLPAAIASARREALGAFGDDDLLLERYLDRPRHIEVQVLADGEGRTVWIGERECSLQRRHQKVVEECPSPALAPAVRERMGAAAVDAARSCGYVGAGTVEFITDAEARDFFFLEMNTRLQVEHPVTELVYGVDLVAEQLRIAAGQPLAFTQVDLRPRGHAVEVRVYAEDPAAGFLPTGGTVEVCDWPDGPGVRVDAGVAAGSVVGSSYDPMLAKVIAHGDDRPEALRRLDAALGQTVLLGVSTNVGFLRRLLDDADVVAGRLDTGLIERKLGDLVGGGVPEDALAAVALATVARREPDPSVPVDPFDVPSGWRVGDHAETRWRLRGPGVDGAPVAVRGRAHAAVVRVGEGGEERRASAVLDAGAGVLRCRVDGEERTYRIAIADDHAWIGRDGEAWLVREEDELRASHRDGAAADGTLVAPMPGTVTVVEVGVGDAVRAGQPLVVVEAMKMEHPITAPFDGIVESLHVRAGQQVAMEEALVVVAPAEAPEEAPR